MKYQENIFFFFTVVETIHSNKASHFSLLYSIPTSFQSKLPRSSPKIHKNSQQNFGPPSGLLPLGFSWYTFFNRGKQYLFVL